MGCSFLCSPPCEYRVCFLDYFQKQHTCDAFRSFFVLFLPYWLGKGKLCRYDLFHTRLCVCNLFKGVRPYGTAPMVSISEIAVKGKTKYFSGGTKLFSIYFYIGLLFYSEKRCNQFIAYTIRHGPALVQGLFRPVSNSVESHAYLCSLQPS